MLVDSKRINLLREIDMIIECSVCHAKLERDRWEEHAYKCIQPILQSHPRIRHALMNVAIVTWDNDVHVAVYKGGVLVEHNRLLKFDQAVRIANEVRGEMSIHVIRSTGLQYEYVSELPTYVAEIVPE